MVAHFGADRFQGSLTSMPERVSIRKSYTSGSKNLGVTVFAMDAKFRWWWSAHQPWRWDTGNLFRSWISIVLVIGFVNTRRIIFRYLFILSIDSYFDVRKYQFRDEITVKRSVHLFLPKVETNSRLERSYLFRLIIVKVDSRYTSGHFFVSFREYRIPLHLSICCFFFSFLNESVQCTRKRDRINTIAEAR